MKLSFSDACRVVMDQIEYPQLLSPHGEDVSGGILAAVVRTMADMYIKPEYMMFTIEGEGMNAKDVQDVYKYIDMECVNELINRLEGNPGCRSVAYMRTCLYRTGLMSKKGIMI